MRELARAIAQWISNEAALPAVAPTMMDDKQDTSARPRLALGDQCGLLPENVGSQFVNRHDTAGGLSDRATTACRDWSNTDFPLVHLLRRHADAPGQICLASNRLDRPSNRFHASIEALLESRVKHRLLVALPPTPRTSSND